jgi:hypothetical protein
MSPTWIEIDDEVMAKIKEQAEPFVDSPNDSLRQLLGLGSAGETTCAALPSERPQAPRRPRAPSGELLSMADYELPLLRALSQAGGSAPKKKVKAAVEAMLAGKLTDLDRGPLESGEIRWENRIGFARLKAIDRGHMRSDSRRGIWELTDAGIERLGQLETELQEQERTESR